ncbi:MAG TPA: PEP-CTERM sorting domain-containing protein, partial [Lacipirellulaceae bacterium]|nr:PEP-CTERM sorting domain-containing protein [Lacipirellulaceae bacterium]
RLQGLSPGTYEVFVVPSFRNPQAAGEKADANVTFAIGLGNTTDARNGGDYTLTSTATTTTQYIATNLTSWVAATDGSTPYNYIGATVTIDSPDRWLTILLGDSTTPGPDRAGPSVIQLRAAGTSPRAGDFSGDGVVDGRDFLIWQRGGSPSPMSGGDLADWQANYGAGLAERAALAVPEPATGLLALLAFGFASRVRRVAAKRQRVSGANCFFSRSVCSGVQSGGLVTAIQASM